MPVPINHRRAGTGPVVVLLHPVGLDLTFWAEIASQLEPDFDVICVDLAGHGDSPDPEPPASLASYADDVVCLLERLAVERTAVVGLSFGGMIAQEIALRRPDLVAGLVACGCPSRFPDEIRPSLAERGAAAERGGMAAVIEPTLARWFSPTFLEIGGAERVRRRLLSQSVAGWAAGWRAISALNTRPRLAGIQAPATCIAGGRDEAVPEALVREMANAIPGARLCVLPGAPHMMHLEDPEPFNAALAAALRAMNEPRVEGDGLPLPVCQTSQRRAS